MNKNFCIYMYDNVVYYIGFYSLFSELNYAKVYYDYWAAVRLRLCAQKEIIWSIIPHIKYTYLYSFFLIIIFEHIYTHTCQVNKTVVGEIIVPDINKMSDTIWLFV